MSVTEDFSDFEAYSNETRAWLFWLDKAIEDVAIALLTPDFIISLIGVFLNVFHLIILTRKSMRNTSTNVLMIGIGFCDLFIMLFSTYSTVLNFLHPVYECWAPSGYPRLIVDLFASALRDDFRRVSAWLGVLMATIRFLIIKTSLNPKYEGLSRPSLGWKIILALFILSSFVSAAYWARIEVVETTPWVPGEQCTGFPANFSETQYGLVMNGQYDSTLLYLKIFLLTEGMLKIIPAVLLPILAFLLIRELNKTTDVRRKITVGQKIETPKKDHTTNLVILMTVTFMVAEGPLGTIYFAQGFLTTKPGFLAMSTNMATVMGIFVSLNATTHCLICLTMSSQYRNCVRTVFCCQVKPKKITVSVSPKTSVTSVRNVVVEV